jgi:hypothetical protein
MQNVLMLAFTGIIAVATVWYAVVTRRLWTETKRSADAAKASADAAKVSADAATRSANVTAALHRPYLGVSALRRDNDYNADMWVIRCCVKNYGTLPAAETRVEVSVERDGHGDFARGPVSSGWEILPQGEFSGFLQFGIGQKTRNEISAAEPMVARVKITYLAPGGTRCTHNAKFLYDRTTRNFRPGPSETNACNE